MQRSMTFVSLLAFTCLALLTLLGCKQPPPNASKPLGIRGYIAVHTEAKEFKVELPERIFLPAIDVFAREVASGDVMAKGRTDLSGRFDFGGIKPGDYEVCWEAKGYVNGCYDGVVSVTTAPVHLSTITIRTATNRPEVSIAGFVRLADGKSARQLNPAEGLNTFAQVELTDDAGNVLATVPVNNFDRYFLPVVPGDRSIALVATIEGSRREFVIDKEAQLLRSTIHQIDLSLRNTAPELTALVPATLAGERMRAFAPGDTVHLTAKTRDRQGDPVSLRWNPEAGTVNDFTASSVEWTLPSAPGRYGIEVVASDGKGGHDVASLDVDANGAGVRFSGMVSGTDVPLLSNADIDVNGTKVRSDAGGYFELYTADTDRFVLTIRKPGYAFVSRIYDGPIRAGHWRLLKASEFNVNLDAPIDVTVQERPPSSCRGRASDRIDWRRYADLIKRPQYQDGNGRTVAPFAASQRPKGKGKGKETYAKSNPPWLPDLDAKKHHKDRDCGPGPRVQIPASAMVDASGTVAAGNATLSIATVDLNTPEQMPGDFTVDIGGGDTGVMRSYGALFVSVNQGANELNLAPGKQATLTLPADPSQLSAAGPLPDPIPTLHYDEIRGVWEQTGQSTLSGNNYVSKVDHFSAVNMDLVKSDQACVRVRSDDIPGNYRLEVTVPLDGGSAPKVKDILVDQSSVTEHVIYNLPTDTNITLVPYNDATDTPYGIFVVNTGGEQNPTSPNRPAGPPYVACSTEVVLQPVTFPPVASAFLEGLTSYTALNISELDPTFPDATANTCGSSNTLVAQSCQSTANYYAQVDPCGKRTNFTDFRATNGLDSGATRLVYANAVDLGFGRDMNCKQNGADVACYVTNYGNAASNDPSDDQADANDAEDQDTPFATVAMEYSPIETACEDLNIPGNQEVLDTEPTVKFFTYNAAGTALLNAADLDGEGARAIPQLCMVCHGGLIPGGPSSEFTNLASVKLGSRFLPFDAAAFVYPTEPGFSQPDQEDEMKTLNEMVVATELPGSSLDELITQWYLGGATEQDEDAVVPGWDAEPAQVDAYRNVVGKVCRTCHIVNPYPNLEFKDHVEAVNALAQIESRVCVDGSMPHAERTHSLFWNSTAPSMVARLQAYGDQYGGGTGWVGDKCGVYTDGGDTPETFFSGTIQSLFEGVGLGATACTNCHVGDTPSGNMRLDAPHSYGEIVGQASSMPGVALDIISTSGTPNGRDESFLWHFINGFPTGNQGYSGGQTQMSPTGQPDDIPKGQIGTWIDDGAQP